MIKPVLGSAEVLGKRLEHLYWYVFTTPALCSQLTARNRQGARRLVVVLQGPQLKHIIDVTHDHDGPFYIFLCNIIQLVNITISQVSL